MDAVKGIPYGVARFEEVRDENFYYVDKTRYLPLLEDTGKYLFLIRPRRFGKSVFVSMMQAYYDIAHCYIMELKYVHPMASDAEVEGKSREAEEQLKKYGADKVAGRLCAGTRLHLLKVVFRGAEMVVCEELVE